jgi:hypothetical protein
MLRILLVAAFISCSASAIIKVDLPVAKLVQQSQAVLVGKVMAADAQRRAIDVEVVEKIKGNPARRHRVILREDEAVSQIDAPVVLFVSGGWNGLLHLGDNWLRLERREEKEGVSAWRITQPYDGAKSFPGRTAALADVVREIKAGGTGLQDWVSHEVCLGGIYKRADTGISGATFMLSHDLNGDGVLDVVAGNAKEVRLLIGRGKGFVDETAKWGLAEARGAKAVATEMSGDVVDLMIGSTVWKREGERFVARAKLDLGDEREWLAMGAGERAIAVLQRDGMIVAEAPAWKGRTVALKGGEILTGAFANDFGDDGRLHAIAVRGDSISRYALDGTESDFVRLTGITLGSYPDMERPPIKPLLVAAYDYDGLGRTDFVLVTEGGGITLANRGHGAFLINRFAHEQFRPGGKDIKLPKLPFEPALSSVMCAPGRQVQMQPKRKRGNLLVLNDNGELWEMDNERAK